MTKQEFINTGLCEQYVLKLTSEEENELVERMLETYPELKKDCLKLENCLGKFCNQNKVRTPKIKFFQKVLRQIGFY